MCRISSVAITAKNDQIFEYFHIFGNIWKVDVSELTNFP